MWLTSVMVYLRAVPLVQLSISAGSGWPYNALQYRDNSEIVKHVNK